jgi:hypothetical protein
MCLISPCMFPNSTTDTPLSKLIERSQAKAPPSRLKGSAKDLNPNSDDVQTSGTDQHQDRRLHPPYTRLDRATGKPVGVGPKDDGLQGKASGDFEQPLRRMFDACGQERDRPLSPRHGR